MKPLLLLLVSLPVFGQSIYGGPAGGSQTTYAVTEAGLASAVAAAQTYQDSTSCVTYIITIPAVGTIDFAGATITLPGKACRQWVILRSDSVSSLPPEGTRLNPATQSTYMPTLESTGSGAYIPVLFTTATGAKTSYWAFEGINFFGNSGIAAGSTFYAAMVQLGETGSTYPTAIEPALRPDHFIFRHCWFHGVAGTRNMQNGLAINADNVRVLDSYIDVIAADGIEAHGVSIQYADGPFELRNTYVNAATENTLMGGSFIPAGLLLSNLSFVGNQYAKQGYYKFGSGTSNPTSACRQDNVWRNTSTNHDWYCNGSSAWVDQGGLTTRGPDVVKNLWEAKMGRGIRIFGNDFSGIWAGSAQNAEVLVFNLTTQSPAYSPLWDTLENIEVSANHISQSIAFLSMAFPGGFGTTACAAPVPSNPCFTRSHNNFAIHDNLMIGAMDERDYDFAGSAEGNGWLAALNSGDFNISLVHNTYTLSTFSVSSGQMYGMVNQINDTSQSNITVANNVTPLGYHGAYASGNGLGGVCSLYVGLATSGPYQFGGSLLTTDLASWSGSSYPIVTGSYVPGCGTYFSWPTGTGSALCGTGAIPGQAACASPAVNAGTFVVNGTWSGTATDGRDPGPDISIVNWATAGAVGGAANPYLDFQVRSYLPAAGGATVYFSALDTTACTATVSLSATFSSPTGSTVFSRTGRNGIATITGLSNDTGYYLKITCAGEYITGNIISGH